MSKIKNVFQEKLLLLIDSRNMEEMAEDMMTDLNDFREEKFDRWDLEDNDFEYVLEEVEKCYQALRMLKKQALILNKRYGRDLEKSDAKIDIDFIIENLDDF